MGNRASSHEFKIFPLCKGHRGLEPVSFPASLGLYTKIQWQGYNFEFDLNGCVQKISGEHPVWPYPEDWLARTQTDRWIYYSGRSYEDIFALTGLYYYPYTQGQENLLDQDRPFEQPHVRKALKAWERLMACLEKAVMEVSEKEAQAIKKILRMTPRALNLRALEFQRLLKATIPVLPPECHRVAYRVVPVVVAEGCTSNCRFCCIKTGTGLAPRPLDDISTQIKHIKNYYGPDLVNFNSVFLGQNDALSAGIDRVISAARMAWEYLEISRSCHPCPRLFLFSGAEALLSLDPVAISALNALPYSNVHINVGIESLDEAALKLLGKPLAAQAAWNCMEKALELNRMPGPLEISLNFVAGDSLPENHWDLLTRTLCKNTPGPYKGTVYISPLRGDIKEPKKLRQRILQLKARSSWPLFLYLIQGL